jgi:hypothetical protein
MQPAASNLLAMFYKIYLWLGEIFHLPKVSGIKLRKVLYNRIVY